MTIQLPPNNGTVTPNFSRPDGGTVTGPSHNTALPDPAAWQNTPPSLPPLPPFTGSQVPIPPPLDGKNGTETRDNLVGKFITLLERGIGVGKAAHSPKATHDSGDGTGKPQDGGGGGSGSGDGNGKTISPSNRHFSVEDLLAVLVTESAQEYKLTSAETQFDTAQKIGILTDEVSKMKSGAKDREIGAILSGVGTLAQGIAQGVGAGVGLRGVNTANAKVTEEVTEVSKQTDLVTQQPKVLDATSQAQIFNMWNSKATSMEQLIQSSGTGLQGGMNLGQGVEEGNAADDDAAKTKDERDAAEADSLHDNAQGMKQQYMQVMQDFVDRAKSLEESQDQTNKAVVQA
jgi:hypothetical protein